MRRGVAANALVSWRAAAARRLRRAAQRTPPRRRPPAATRRLARRRRSRAGLTGCEADLRRRHRAARGRAGGAGRHHGRPRPGRCPLPSAPGRGRASRRWRPRRGEPPRPRRQGRPAELRRGRAGDGDAQRRARARPWPSWPATRPCTCAASACAGSARREPVDLGTVFQLGAVSARLHERDAGGARRATRELAWDAPVRRYWPGFASWDPWVSDHVTLRDLLAMRSGLPAHAGDELLAFGYGRAEVLRRLQVPARRRPASAPRSPSRRRCPTAAAVAAEHATGSVVGAARAHAPARAAGDDLDDADLGRLRGRSRPWRRRTSRVGGVMQAQTPRGRDVLAPALGVSSSIGDLVPYVRMQLNGGAVAGVRVAAGGRARRDAGADDGRRRRTGRDRWRRRSAGTSRASTAPPWSPRPATSPRGSSALVSMVPADGVGIVVLANSYPQGHALAAALAATLYDLYILGAPREDWLAAGGPTRRAEATLGRRAGSAARGRRASCRRRRRPARRAPRSRSVYAGAYAQRYYGRDHGEPRRGRHAARAPRPRRDDRLPALGRRHLARSGHGHGRRVHGDAGTRREGAHRAAARSAAGTPPSTR